MPRGTGDPGAPSPRPRGRARSARARGPRPLTERPTAMTPRSRPTGSTGSRDAGARVVEPDPGAREKIHLEILRRTGAYRTDDHFLLPVGASRAGVHRQGAGHDRAVVHRGPGRHHRASTSPPGRPTSCCRPAPAPSSWPTAWPGRCHPGPSSSTRPRASPARADASGCPDEFTRFVRKGSKVLIVEDLITTGETIRLLIKMVQEAGGVVVGIGCLWQRATKIDLGKDVFSLVKRDFPTYERPAARSAPAASRSTSSSPVRSPRSRRLSSRRARGDDRRSRRTASRPAPPRGRPARSDQDATGSEDPTACGVGTSAASTAFSNASRRPLQPPRERQADPGEGLEHRLAPAVDREVDDAWQLVQVHLDALLKLLDDLLQLLRALADRPEDRQDEEIGAVAKPRQGRRRHRNDLDPELVQVAAKALPHPLGQERFGHRHRAAEARPEPCQSTGPATSARPRLAAEALQVGGTELALPPSLEGRVRERRARPEQSRDRRGPRSRTRGSACARSCRRSRPRASRPTSPLHGAAEGPDERPAPHAVRRQEEVPDHLPRGPQQIRVEPAGRALLPGLSGTAGRPA